MGSSKRWGEDRLPRAVLDRMRKRIEARGLDPDLLLRGDHPPEPVNLDENLRDADWLKRGSKRP